MLCSSSMVEGAWVWFRSRLVQLLPTNTGAVGVTSEEFLLLQFPKDIMNKECVWLHGNYYEIVNNVVIGRQCKLGADQWRGE